MPFVKGQSGNPGGMAKGTKHRATLAKEAFLECFETTGGADGLIEWLKDKKNFKEFYKMIVQLLPKDVEVGGEGGGPIRLVIRASTDSVKSEAG